MNRAHIAAIGLTLLGACACGSPSDPAADASRPDRDGGTDAAGVTLRFSSTPPIPGSAPGSAGVIEIESVEIELVDLRVLGDVTPDERTIEPAVTLDWGEGGSCGDDECVTFSQAPPGLYSLVVCRLARVLIEGNLTLSNPEMDGGSEDMEFDIKGENLDTEVEVAFPAVGIEPGGSVVMNIQIQLDTVVHSVDWDTAGSDDEDEVEITPSDPQFGAVLAALAMAFHASEP
jgi:hypothetical protein